MYRDYLVGFVWFSRPHIIKISAMPIFERVCCCMSLLQGAQVFGYIGFLGFVYNFSRKLILLASTRESADFLKSNLIFMQFLVIVVSLCLIAATITGNRTLVLPWLVAFWPAVVFLNILILFFSTEVFGELTIYEDYRAKFVFLTNLDGFGIYVWLCIFSYYQSLNRDCTGTHQLLLDVK